MNQLRHISPRMPGAALSIGMFTLLACQNPTTLEFAEGLKHSSYNSAESNVKGVSKRFQLTAAEEKTITINTGFGIVTTPLTLEQKPNSEDVFRQVDRTMKTQDKTQGHDGDSMTETFAVSEAGLFDLLIVIDDSSSMEHYQSRLSKSLPALLTHIKNTNWHIAVSSTSSSCLNKTNSGKSILTRKDFDADPESVEQNFIELTTIGITGDPTEKGILSAADALNGICEGDVNPWLRHGAARAVLLVTDEHNCGSASNEGCGGEAYASSQYFFDNAPENTTVHGLLLLEEPPAIDPSNPSDPNLACIGSGGYLNPPNPSQYLDMIDKTGGLVSDICRSDFSTVLEQISASVKDKINVSYELSYTPEASSEAVKIDGVAIENYSIEGNILSIYDELTVDQNDLEITYLHTPVARFDRVNLETIPDPKTLVVYENNKAIPRKNYEYSSVENAIIFSADALPEDRSLVQVRYREDSPLKKDFELSETAIADSVQVFVDDMMQPEFTIDENRKKISFASAPSDNAKVMIRYEKPNDKKINYPVTQVNIEKIERIRIEDAITGEEIEGFIDENDDLIIASEYIHNNRKILVHYDLLFKDDELKFDLPKEKGMIPETLVIKANTEGSSCTADILIDTETIGFSCTDDSPETIKISYQYSNDYSNVFRLDVDPISPKTWNVRVNNKPIKEFYVFNDTVVIQREILPAGATVYIEAMYLE